ncbi:DUF2793 domain-containing protein [Sphingomonas panacisoli]|uniref:DUF2793 domain-containing protein n=1 Tax=Sphingomonas panacisoli TaxID=1813879 RepID=A0A5B8LKJ4_9SPHN|nr:DUF2793 domain-containing protein [Sphingomonas panacisoli]QDZ08671.1 DUF2793 domain-containing protein [Sphingomonas panacisoli]
MSDTQTDRFSFPLLQPGQAQKEMSHNEALTALDLLIQPTAEAIGLDTPPTAPDSGQSWIVGAAPTGAWAGKAFHLAGWTSGGWRFVAPVEGMAAWVTTDGLTARFSGGSWVLGEDPCAHLVVGGNRVVGPRQSAIAAPSGGAVIDAESRAALTAILAALRAHGLIAT